MDYSEKVLEHFRNPKNLGKMKDPDGTGKVGNLACGDVMHLYIKVGRNKNGEETIEDIRFETFGCAAAISSSSIITELVKGKTIKEAVELEKGEVIDQLGGLPPIKIHCSVLAVDALSEAIYDYLQGKGKKIPDELKKRHQKIAKAKEEVRKRYGKWVKAEEKALEE